MSSVCVRPQTENLAVDGRRLVAWGFDQWGGWCLALWSLSGENRLGCNRRGGWRRLVGRILQMPVTGLGLGGYGIRDGSRGIPEPLTLWVAMSITG
jgi:hypothetical protein